MEKDVVSERLQKIVEAFNATLSSFNWEQSNFLKIIEKKLIQIRAKVEHELESHKGANQDAQETLGFGAHYPDHQEIFIALYSSFGNELQNWERIIHTLPDLVVSRPVYEKEKEVKTIMNAKENKLNEGYVAIYIRPQDILQREPDKLAFDKFGHPLLSLKAKALSLEKITRFVHISGIYSYHKGHLTKISEDSSF